MEKKSTLENKLKKYSALAGGLTAVAGGVNAQIIYTDVNPDATVAGNGTTFAVDFDNNAVTDLTFVTFTGSSWTNTIPSYGNLVVSYTGVSGGLVNAPAGNGWMSSSSSLQNVAPQAAIGGAGAFGTGTGTLGVEGYFTLPAYPGYGSSFSTGNFIGQTGYVGAKFDIGGATHYGWVRLSLSADSHTITVMDFAYDGTAGTAVNAGELVTIDTTGISCNGAADGTLTAVAAQGLPTPLTYAWTDGGGNPVGSIAAISSLGPDTYTVVVTDGLANTHTASYTLSEPAALGTTAVVTNEAAGNDGAIDLTVTGGTMPYTFDWDNNGTGSYTDTEDLTGLAAGTYNVSVMDANGCITTHAETLILTMGTPTVTETASILCNGDMTAELSAAPLGGSAPFTYVWKDAGGNTIGTAQTITGLGAGTYTVEVTDNNSDMMSQSYTVAEPTALAASTTTTDETFGNDGAVDLTVTGGTPTYTYAWDNSATTEDLAGVVAGTYNVTVTDANGCTVSAAGTVISTVGIEETESVISKVYPNPTTGAFRIEFGSDAGLVEVSLVDISGRILTKETRMNPNYLEMNVSEFSNGIYTVLVRTENSVSEMKIVKE